MDLQLLCFQRLTAIEYSIEKPILHYPFCGERLYVPRSESKDERKSVPTGNKEELIEYQCDRRRHSFFVREADLCE